MGKNRKRISKKYIDKESGRAKQGKPGHLKKDTKKPVRKK